MRNLAPDSSDRWEGRALVPADRISKRIRVEVTESLLEEIDRHVEKRRAKAPPRTRVTRSWFLRAAAREYLKRHPK